MDPTATSPRAPGEKRPLRLSVLRGLLLIVFTVIIGFGLMYLRSDERRAVRLATDVASLRIVGWGQLVLAASGLFVVAHAGWRRDETAWRVLATYFWSVGLLLGLVHLATVFLLSPTPLGNAYIPVPGLAWGLPYILLAQQISRGVDERIWELQGSRYGRIFR